MTSKICNPSSLSQYNIKATTIELVVAFAIFKQMLVTDKLHDNYLFEK